MNIMVTGANGGYGSYALDYLKQFSPNDNLFGLVRSEAKGTDLKEKGVNVRIGDYANADSMKKALKGIDRLLFVSSSIPNIQNNVIAAAKENGVKYIAYTSIYQPDYSQFGLEINHKQTEQWLKDSGIPHTFLRDSWYMELNQGLFEYAQKTHEFPYFSEDGPLSFALRREFAEAGARVILDGNYGEIVNLAGNPITFGQLALVTQDALNEKLDIKKVTESEFVSDMNQVNISAQLTTMSELYQKYALKGNNGEDKADSTEFEKVLGHPLTELPVAINEILNNK